ncbi:hypothetical protein [Pseudofrankia sp. BMG5.36]|uniref:hypothetical protein n=1 Tax=Pseudofrankia sp. BMG5.36 TaxID=1834512 RepID=UPI0008D9C696|nr:hypothetical protein [Pseudofrankia sp. BMG5.36]OHV43675.1 hypothetical protein BCD48_27215 [Pseudofrankia sp. BMG5.36]
MTSPAESDDPAPQETDHRERPSAQDDQDDVGALLYGDGDPGAFGGDYSRGGDGFVGEQSYDGGDRGASDSDGSLDDADSDAIDADLGERASIRMAGVGDVGQAGPVFGGDNRGVVQEQGTQNNTTVNGGNIGSLINQPTFAILMSEARDGFLQRLGNRQQVSRTRDIRWLSLRFAPPDRYEEAVATLRKHRVVLLTGEAGSGRLAAATMALWSVTAADRTNADHTDVGGKAHVQGDVDDGDLPLRHPAASSTEIIRDLATPEDLRDGGGSWPSSDEIEPGERLRLDLSRTAGALRRKDTERLLDLAVAVAARPAWLAIVVSKRILQVLPMELGICHVRIGRPDPVAVLARHLRADGVDLSESDLRSADQEGRLEGLPTEMVSRLAQGAPRPLGVTRGESSSPSKWLPLALDAVTGNEVAIFHSFAEQMRPTQENETAWRIRLASVAMLEGSTAPVIALAEWELIRICGPADSPSREPHPFEREDLDSWLSSVGAVASNASVARTSQVRFAQPMYGVAARRYFWTQHPHLVDVYLTWFDGLAHGLARRQRDGRAAATLLANRIAEQMLASAAVDDLLRLSMRWMKVSNPAHIAAAAWILRLGLDDEAIGSQVRSAFYEWSQGSRLTFDGARTVIALCLDPLGLSRPELATTRLMHFLGHEQQAVGDVAVKALLDLAAKEDRHRLVLTRVLRLLADRPSVDDPTDGEEPSPIGRRERRCRNAIRVFLELASVDRLTSAYPEIFSGASNLGPGLDTNEPRPAITTFDGLAGAWRVALEQRTDSGALTARLADWLTSASTSSSSQILDILAAACGRRVDLQNRLSALALAATRGSVTGNSLARNRAHFQLLERIAQSDELLTGSVPAHQGGTSTVGRAEE